MAVKMVFRSALPDEAMDAIRSLGVEARIARSDEEALAQIADADAFYGTLTPALLAAAANLRWVQAESAGLDNFFFPELRESAVTITNQRGIYSDVIADHVFGFILAFARGLDIYSHRQRDGRWDSRGVEVIDLPGKRLGIIGLGGIGLEVARRGSAFGMTILAVDPAPKGIPEYVEAVWGPEGLHEMLPRADFVVICTPHTAETEYMIGAEALKAMKPKAFLINIGRGKVVDLKALDHALETKQIAGAGLDVFEEEPLPEGHPLWSRERVIITPHVAAVSPRIAGRRTDLIVENVRRFSREEPLLNIVDKQKGYVVELTP